MAYPQVKVMPKLAPQPRTTPLSDNEKRAIAAYIQQQSKLYKFCFDTASKDFEGVDISVREVATTLYLSASKHFNL